MAGEISQALLAAIRARIGEIMAIDRTDAELYGWLNEAQDDLVARSLPSDLLQECLEVKECVWSPGVDHYDLPCDFLTVTLVKVGGVIARRLELADLSSLAFNAYWTASRAKPRYCLMNDGISFFTDGQDPTELTYTLYYLKLPKWEREIATIARASDVVSVTFAAPHGFTSANANNTVVIEDSTASFNGEHVIRNVPNTTTLRISQEGSDETGSGGRVVNMGIGQISATEDPKVNQVFHGLLCDWAVIRAREQVSQYEEAERQRQHYAARCELIGKREAPNGAR